MRDRLLNFDNVIKFTILFILSSNFVPLCFTVLFLLFLTALLRSLSSQAEGWTSFSAILLQICPVTLTKLQLSNI